MQIFYCVWLSNLQNRDEWAQKEGKLWVAWVEVDECEGLVEMKAGSHLWREGLLISPLSISPGGEERWLGGGGGRGRVSRSMSCSVETLSLRFPHICPSGKRWNEDKLKIISPTSSQTTLLSRFLVISSYWICRRRLASFCLIRICRRRRLAYKYPGKRSKLCLTPLRLHISH